MLEVFTSGLGKRLTALEKRFETWYWKGLPLLLE